MTIDISETIARVRRTLDAFPNVAVLGGLASTVTVGEVRALLDAAEAGVRARDAALFLFKLLDDIDTAEDMAKSDDNLFRAMAHKAHRRRFEVAETDGYTVALKGRPS